MNEKELFSKAENIRDVLRYVRKFKNTTVVIYIDDRIIHSSLFISHIKDICSIHETGIQVIIIPGARQRIDQVLEQASIPWTMKDDIRLTNAHALPLIKMAAFDVSNIIMTRLAGEGKTAVIGNWVRARSMGIKDGIDYSSSGEIDKINIDAVNTILKDRFIPIFPCIGWSSVGKPYNISSIKLAAEVAKRLQADKLFFLIPQAEISTQYFEIPLSIQISPQGKIPAMNMEETNMFLQCNEDKNKENPELKKLRNLVQLAQETCMCGVSRVHILDGLLDGTLLCEIFSDFGSGTMIYKSNYGGIRSMTAEDIPSIMNLIRPFVEKGILLPRTEQDLITTYTDYIVYELDEGIKACAALHLYDDTQAEIAAVAVDSSYSNMGVGPKLVDYLLDIARKKMCSSVFILTTQTSDWFESLGFEPDSIETLPEKRKKKWSPERGSKLYRKNLQ